jgi:hypothetical protein
MMHFKTLTFEYKSNIFLMERPSKQKYPLDRI